jgi:hypothetical protein
MRVSIKNIALKIFVGFMAMQVLNLSVDAIEFHPLITSHVNDIGDFNDLNSAAEYISEILLGHKNAFPEFDKKPDSKQSLSFKHVDMKKYSPNIFSIEPPHFEEIISYICPLVKEEYLPLYIKEINPPPPKTC